MSAAFDPQAARRALETDPIWSAYALADLDPGYAENAHWWVNKDSVLLRFDGFYPPVLFACGAAARLRPILAQLPPERVQYTLRPEHRRLFNERLAVEQEFRAWRMVLEQGRFRGAPNLMGVRPLGPQDLPAIQALFDGQPDQPDAFSPAQLETGAFFGAQREGALVSVAGVHVLSHGASVAALGNVYTHPAFRRQGLGAQVSAAVVQRLLEMGIETIVLNVSQENVPALRIYRGLGFRVHCDYIEGAGDLRAAQAPA